MDKFSVSGQDLRNFYDEETTLEKVFGDIERDLKAENKVVCQYFLNGLSLSEVDEGRFAQTPLKEVETLEYLAENSADLLEKVTVAWMEALPEIIHNAEVLAEELRSKGPRGQLKKVHDIIENTEFLISSVSTIKVMLGDTVIAGIPDWAKAEASSLAAVREALTAMNRKDFVGLSHILEYDLTSCLEMWLTSLAGIGKGLGIDFSVSTSSDSKPAQGASAHSSGRGESSH